MSETKDIASLANQGIEIIDGEIDDPVVYKGLFYSTV
jgi:hypothetical protein